METRWPIGAAAGIRKQGRHAALLLTDPPRGREAAGPALSKASDACAHLACAPRWNRNSLRGTDLRFIIFLTSANPMQEAARRGGQQYYRDGNDRSVMPVTNTSQSSRCSLLDKRHVVSASTTRRTDTGLAGLSWFIRSPRVARILVPIPHVVGADGQQAVAAGGCGNGEVKHNSPIDRVLKHICIGCHHAHAVRNSCSA